MTHYKQGDHVEYRPVGGAEDTVSHSTGVVEAVVANEVCHQERQHREKYQLPGTTASIASV